MDNTKGDKVGVMGVRLWLWVTPPSLKGRKRKRVQNWVQISGVIPTHLNGFLDFNYGRDLSI